MKHLYLLFLLALSNAAIAQVNTEGLIDHSFANNGYLIENLDPIVEYGEHLADAVVQSNDKITVLGYYNSHGVLLRYMPNGTPDASFGTGGKIDLAPEVQISDLTVLDNDKIVFVGAYKPSNTNWRVMVGGLNADGTMDTSFGPQGYIAHNAIQYRCTLWSMAMQGDKIVAAGLSASNEAPKFFVERFNSNGSIDNTFGTNGLVSMGIDTSIDRCHVKVYNNKIYVGGQVRSTISPPTNNDLFVLCLGTDGTFDNTFGTGGIVRKDLDNANSNDTYYSMTISPTGNIYVGGMYGEVNLPCVYPGVLSVAYTGSVNNAFSSDGIFYDQSLLGLNAYAMMTDSQERIYIVGRTPSSTPAILRLNPNGTFDNTFGVNGLASDPNYQDLGDMKVILRQSTGNIVLLGNMYDGTTFNLMAVRYKASAEPTAINTPLAKTPGLSIYPNPSTGSFTLTLNSPATTPASLQLVSTLGDIVFEKKIALTTGDNIIGVEANNLAQGVYFTKITTPTGFYTHKLIIDGK